MKGEPVRRVAALILDGPLAPETARRAAALARKESLPLILLVPVERTGFSINSVTHRLAAIRQTAEAETIAARVRPVLDSTGTEAEVLAVPCLSRGKGTTGNAMLKSITAAARRMHAIILVTPTGNDAEVTTQKTPHRQLIEPSAAKHETSARSIHDNPAVGPGKGPGNGHGTARPLGSPPSPVDLPYEPRARPARGGRRP